MAAAASSTDRPRGGFGDAGADRLAGELQIERLATTQQAALGQDAEDEVGVGVGRFGPALPVAGRARHGLRAVGTDLEVAAGIDPGDCAAAGADRMDLERGDVDRVMVDDRRRRPDRLAVDDEADEEGRAARVGGDDVVVAELPTEGHRPDHPAGQHRTDGRDGVARRFGRGDRAAVALHDEEGTGELMVAQPALEFAEVVPEAGADLGAHHRGRVARELTDAWADLTRQRDEHGGVDLGDDLANPLFVGRVTERPQQRDGDGGDPVVEQLTDRSAHLVLVQRHHDTTVTVHALGDLERVTLVDQTVGFVLREHILQLFG